MEAIEVEAPAVTEDNRTPVTKLSCAQCEFLSFKNIDAWKNHFVGHWRLDGMTNDYKVQYRRYHQPYYGTGNYILYGTGTRYRTFTVYLSLSVKGILI